MRSTAITWTIRVLRWAIPKQQALLEYMKKKCPHRLLHFVADAWDYEYICVLCDRRWFNEVPKIVASLKFGDSWFHLDGTGKAPAELTVQ